MQLFWKLFITWRMALFGGPDKTGSTRPARSLYIIQICCLLGITSPVQAQNWLLLEAHDIPAHCAEPLACLDQGELILRNLIHMPAAERQVLLQALNSLSVIRGIPAEDGQAPVGLDPQDMIEILHPMPKADKLATLIDHPGVYFDSTRLDAGLQTAEFSNWIREELTKAGIPLLTEEERDATPGRPTLSVRYSPRSESAGCIIPFSISISITEETVMVRNPALKVTGTTWAKTARQNLANTNYSLNSALQEVISALVSDWKSQNP